MQGTWVQSLVGELNSTCVRAIKPMPQPENLHAAMKTQCNNNNNNKKKKKKRKEKRKQSSESTGGMRFFSFPSFVLSLLWNQMREPPQDSLVKDGSSPQGSGSWLLPKQLMRERDRQGKKEWPWWSHNVLYRSILWGTYCHFCHILLVTQANPGVI